MRDTVDFPEADAPGSPPIIVDSFAGGGGASTGIERALGRSPDVAINHSAAALALHAANHPETRHIDSNIWDVDPMTVHPGRRIGLLWASPDCKHFSKAKGSALRDRNIRDLAWVVVRWAEMRKPDVIIMENVEEFVTWCPIGEDGRILEWLKGETFKQWVKRFRAAGYRIQWRELRACDFGAPTIRKRLFIIARRDGNPIVWPKPTHGDPSSPAVKSGRRLPWRTAAECIDWSLPCPSIFDTADEIKAKHGVRAVRPLADNTMARIARGMKRYVLEADRPFTVNLTHGGHLEDAAAPLRTITGANRGEKAVVVPSITRFNGGATGQHLRDPLATITANSWIKKPGGAVPLAVLAPSLMSLKGTDRRGSAADTPHPTVLAGGRHSALISPVLTYAQQGGRCRPADAPHHTITASKKDQNAVLVPGLVHIGNGERPGQAPRSLDPHAPLGTIVAAGPRQYPFAAYLAQQNGGPRMGAHAGHDARRPISTVAASGSQQTPVAAFFAKYYGAGTGSAADEPCHTITVNDRFGHVEATLAAPPFGPEHEAKALQVAGFLRAHGAWSEGEYVTVEIDGETFIVVDIGLRMLTPRELYRAQGFPDDYVIEGIWEEADGEWSWRPFSKNVQISCVGNSVCPPMAEALVRANCGHLVTQEVAA